VPEIRTVALVDPIEDSRRELRSLLLGIDWVHLDSECTRYDAFMQVVEQSNPKPNAAIVSLDADPNQAFALIDHLSGTFPDMPIMVCSSRHQSLIHAYDRGVKSLLVFPPRVEDITEKLGKLLGATVRRGLTIAILGSRGGVGCTSLAVNLGACLAANPDHQVVLVDLDLGSGDADVALDVTPDYRLSDFAIRADKIDLQFLKGGISKHEASGLHLVPRPIQMQDIGMIKEDHIARILMLLRLSYTHLILDLRKGWTPLDIVALRAADLIILVTQLDVSSLRNSVYMVNTLVQEDMGEKIRIVINRAGTEAATEGVDSQKAEEILGRPIYWEVPNDTKAMFGAWKMGTPLRLYAPKSRSHLSIAELAQSLQGLTPSAKKAVANGKTSSLTGLFRVFRGKSSA
jgi:pilus assembly protein CpaE